MIGYPEDQTRTPVFSSRMARTASHTRPPGSGNRTPADPPTTAPRPPPAVRLARQRQKRLKAISWLTPKFYAEHLSRKIERLRYRRRGRKIAAPWRPYETHRRR